MRGEAGLFVFRMGQAHIALDPCTDVWCHFTMASKLSPRVDVYRVMPVLLFIVATLCDIGNARGGHDEEDKQGGPPPRPMPGNPNGPICPTTGAPFPADLVQPHEPANAGSIEGFFSVDSTGNARYELPLVALPGRAGMVPQVSVVCDGGGDGPEGVGCSLNGFSRITRCPKNRAQDGVIAPVRYDTSDAFCLDGRRLILVSTSGPVDEYRTIPDSFSRVEAFYPQGWIRAQGPKSFRVSTKHGIVAEYGTTNDSRAKAKHGIARAWWIARSTDRSGNFIDYDYLNLEDISIPSQPFTNELLPNRIAYTGHPNAPATRLIEFQYVSRSSDTIRTTFSGGMALVDSKLLDAVEMRGPGNTTLRRYELGYSTSQTTARAQLSRVSECASTGGPCKPPTTFTWNAPSTGFEDIATDLPLPQYPEASLMTTDLDGNGLDDIVMIDGEPSGVPVSHFYTATNEGAAQGFFSFPYAGAFFLDFNLWPTAHRERGTPIDFDHDGRQDLFLHDINGNSGHWKVLRTDANGLFSMVDTGISRPFPGGQAIPTGLKGPEASAHLLDMDGDGMTDLISCTSNGNGTGFSWTYRSWTETGFSSIAEAIAVLDIQPCDSEAYTVDIDGDGKTELLVRDAFMSADGAQYLNDYAAIARVTAGDFDATVQGIDAVPPGGAMFFLDVNGDGLADALQTGYSDHQPYVFINTGQRFLSRVNGLPGNVFPADEFAQFATAIDYNGDGRQDLLLPIAEPGQIPTWRVLRSKGNGTFAMVHLPDVPFDAVLMQEGTSLAHPFAARVFEADGDGANDILLPQSSTNSFHVYRNRAKFADALSTITDGMAPYTPAHTAFRPQIAIEYSTLATNNVYEKGEDCQYPLRCAAGPHRVVAAYEEDSGGTQPRRFEFAYRDGKYDRLGRGFLGFAERVVRDVDKNSGQLEVYDNTTFDASFNTYPFAHQPSEVISWTPTADEHDLLFELSFQSTTLQVAPTNNGASYFTVPVVTRSRREQGRIHLFLWATEFLGSYEAYARAAYAGTTDSVRLSDSIHTILDFDEYANTLAEKTLIGREFNLFAGPLDAQSTVIERASRMFKNNIGKWQIGLLQTHEECSTAAGVGSACRTTDNTFDALARLKTTTRTDVGDSETWVRISYGYDTFGNVTSTRADDAFGEKRIACTSYDAEGMFPYAQGNPEGHISFAKFHAGFGVPVAAIDPNGRVTQWALDEYGRAIKEKRPDGTETTTTITRTQDAGPQQDQFVVRVSSSTPGWAEENVELDRMGRAIRHWSRGTTINGVTRPRLYDEVEYDDHGEFVLRTLVPTEETTPIADRKYHTFLRDNLGRVTKQIAPWGAATETKFNGVQVEVHPPGIPPTVTEFDGLGRPTRVEDAGGGTTSYGYGVFGFLRTVTDPGGAVTTTIRDSLGRVRTSSDPDRGSTVFRYSGFGEARQTIDALGRQSQFFYDRLGRLLRRVDADGETLWKYDIATNGIGAPANVLSPNGVVRRWGYDNKGRPISSTLEINGELFTMGFDYDAQSRVSQIRYPAINGSSFVVENHYDDVGHLVRVNESGQSGNLWTLTGVSRNGFISGEQFGNNANQAAQTARIYDEARGLVSSIVTSGQTPLQSLSYTYDALQNLQSRTDHLQGGPSGRVETFQYDALQRLKCAAFDGESPCARQWNYQPNGNFNSTSFAGSYTYDPARPHVVANTNLGSYQHDAVGNQIGRPDATVQYTALNLPKRIDWTNGNVTTFAYDGRHQRVRKTSGLVESIFVGEWYERVNNAGAVEHRHYVRSSERVVAVVTKSSAVTKTQYLHTDHAGSVDVVSTSTGALDERRSYDPFGARRNPDWGKPPGALTNGTALGFTGHLGDEELGLVFMRGRVYDPKLGRFLTPDPFVTRVLSGQNWNRYAYVENNPLNYTDPSGFEGESADEGSRPKVIDNQGRPTDSLEVEVRGIRPPRPEPLGAMRPPVDVGSYGDSPGFYPDAPASGSERDQADGLDIMLDVLEGAATGYGQDVLSNMQGMVLFAVFPQGYFAWQGYNFWSGVIDVGREGYAQDGIWGGIAAGLGQIVNVFVPVVDAGIGLAKTIDAAEKGDYKHAGEYGYGAAKAVAGVLAVGIGAGVARGGGPPINAQKQAGHVQGTPQYANRIKGGKWTSSFLSGLQGELVTLEAWKNGTPLGTNGTMRLHEFGKPVGVAPTGGGYQTQVRVSMDASGQIHGTPWGPIFEGPMMP